MVTFRKYEILQVYNVGVPMSDQRKCENNNNKKKHWIINSHKDFV